MQFNFRHQLQPLLELRPERTHIAVNVAAPAHQSNRTTPAAPCAIAGG
jgi:hypothetical protein